MGHDKSPTGTIAQNDLMTNQISRLVHVELVVFDLNGGHAVELGHHSSSGNHHILGFLFIIIFCGSRNLGIRG